MDRLLARDPEAFAYAIQRSCVNKAEVSHSQSACPPGISSPAGPPHVCERPCSCLPASFAHALSTAPQRSLWCLQHVHPPQVVAADEREGGVRASLNLGHTFGHAIETNAGYGAWLHGEAVAAGMAMAADLSYRLGWIEGELVQRIRALLERANLPLLPPEVRSVWWPSLPMLPPEMLRALGCGTVRMVSGAAPPRRCDRSQCLAPLHGAGSSVTTPSDQQSACRA